MTVYELERRMPVEELFMWLRYFNPEGEAAAPTADNILAEFGLK
jgi:hypothetical protein